MNLLKGKLLLPSLRDFGLFLIVASLFIAGNRNLLADGDALYHIRAGEWMMDHRSLPNPEPFSYGMEGREWIAHEWLSEVISGAVFRGFGLDGVCLMYLGILGLTYFLLTEWVRRRWGFLSCLAVIGLFFVTSVHWLARPHLWTHLFVVVYLIGLHRWSQNERFPGWIFPLIMIAWVNLHGGYMAGFVLLGIAQVAAIWAWWRGGKSAGDAARILRMAGILGLTLLASCMNPYGVSIWINTLNFVGDSSATKGVQEFLSPNFRNEWLLLAAYGGIASVMIGSRIRPTTEEFLRFVIFGFMSLQAVRHAPIFVFVMCSGIGRRIASWTEGAGGPRFLKERLASYQALEEKSVPGFWPVIILVAAIVACVTGYDFAPDPRTYPREALRYLREHPMSGRGFNTDPIGDYMIWELWPQYRVFVDGRSDFYDGPRGRDYDSILKLNGDLDETLRRNDFSWAIIEPSPLLTYMSTRTDWETIFSSPQAVILKKRTP